MFKDNTTEKDLFQGGGKVFPSLQNFVFPLPLLLGDATSCFPLKPPSNKKRIPYLYEIPFTGPAGFSATVADVVSAPSASPTFVIFAIHGKDS